MEFLVSGINVDYYNLPDWYPGTTKNSQILVAEGHGEDQLSVCNFISQCLELIVPKPAGEVGKVSDRVVTG